MTELSVLSRCDLIGMWICVVSSTVFYTLLSTVTVQPNYQYNNFRGTVSRIQNPVG